MDFPYLLALETLGLDVLAVVNFLTLLNFLFLFHGHFGEESTGGVHAAFCHLVNVMHQAALELHNCLLFFSVFAHLVVACLQDLVNEPEVVFFQPRLTNVAQSEVFLGVGDDCFLELEEVAD